LFRHASNAYYSWNTVLTEKSAPDSFGISFAACFLGEYQSNQGATMTVLDFVILLVVAGICGAIGQAIVGYSRGGCLASIALGFIGALLGAWLARALNLPEMFQLVIGDQPFPIIWSIIGATLFVALISLMTSGRTWWYRRRTWW
jgi:uncharacterized membrane protein YeaQ/YmgE (transglycosylase-associated protein family)